jgi:long-chain acyl-CoA synthetase
MLDKPWLKHYREGVPHSIDYPDVPVHQFLLDTVAAHPDWTATSFNDIDISYRDLNERVNRFAWVLQESGVQKGDRIAFVLVNSPTYVIAFFAALKLGAVVVNISVGLQGEELLRCLDDSGATSAVSLDLFAQNIYAVIHRTPIRKVFLHSVFGLEQKIVAEPGAPKPRIFLEALAAAPAANEPNIVVSSRDLAVLQYTSGSTGAPKAAALTHANIVSSVLQTEVWVGIKGAGNAAVVCIIPFFHVFGMSACLLVSVLKGYKMVLLPRMDAMDILPLMKTFETHRPISFPAVPSLWTAIMSLPPETAGSHLASVQVAVSGGAPLAPAVQEKYGALTGRRVMEAYGLSEASSTTHITPFPQGGPAGSIGLPVPDTDVMIVDQQTGERVCAAGEIGELVVRGPQVMQGYWNNPELTAKTLRDGWLHTGDLARMDENGFFYLVDRKDDLIISSGFNIYPSQIETVLKRHPKVKDCAVVGTPDRARGQAITAVIVLREGGQGGREEFLAFCRENMPDFRVPKTILFREEIPRDPAGKVRKRVLREELR